MFAVISYPRVEDSWNFKMCLEYALLCMDAEHYPQLEDHGQCAGCLQCVIRMLSI